MAKPFRATRLFLYPLKTSAKKIGFLISSGGTEKDQWHDKC